MSQGRSAGAALILDADNISDAATLERVLARLQERGWRLTVRRAYGGHDKLAGLKDCLSRHAIRAFVNQGKGTTDALIVVDVMDLLHAGTLPGLVVIASSDGDFAPLAVRLREAGISVICCAQAGKAAAEELAKVYDEVVFVDAPAASRAAARAPEPKPARVSEPKPARAPEPKPARAPRKAVARKAAPAQPPRAEPPSPLRQSLAAVRGFDAGELVELNEVVRRLREDKLLGKTASGPKFLLRHAPYVELVPEKQPNKVRLRAA